MKSKVTINMDTYLLEELKHSKINISQMAENAGRSAIAAIKGDVNGINEQLTKLELEKLEKEVVKRQGKITQLRNSLDQLSEIRASEKEVQLVEEQKRIEKETKCPNCKNVLTNNNFVLLKDDVRLCKACFGISEVAKKYLKGDKK